MSNETTCRARYHALTGTIELDWLNADAPNCEPHGKEILGDHQIPCALNALFIRCYDALRIGGRGQWVDLTTAEMVSYGVKRI